MCLPTVKLGSSEPGAQPDGAQRRDAQPLHSVVIYKQVITLVQDNFKPNAPNRNDLLLKAPAPTRSLCTLLLLHCLTIRRPAQRIEPGADGSVRVLRLHLALMSADRLSHALAIMASTPGR